MDLKFENNNDAFIKQLRSKIMDWDDEKYYNDIGYVTNSMLSQLKRSPLHLHVYLNKLINKETQANIFGRAFHCGILEPNEFDKRFYVLDDSKIVNKLIDEGSGNPRGTKRYKEWKEDFLAHVGDRTELSLDDYDSIKRMQDKVHSITEIRQMIDITEKEVVMQNEYDEVKTKIKVDAIRPGDFFFDLKSTKDPATFEGFQSSFYRYSYDRQIAFYGDMSSTPNGFIIAVEKTFPFSVGIFSVSQETYDEGRNKYLSLLNDYKRIFLRNEIQNLDTYYTRATL